MEITDYDAKTYGGCSDEENVPPKRGLSHPITTPIKITEKERWNVRRHKDESQLSLLEDIESMVDIIPTPNPKTRNHAVTHDLLGMDTMTQNITNMTPQKIFQPSMHPSIHTSNNDTATSNPYITTFSPPRHQFSPSQGKRGSGTGEIRERDKKPWERVRINHGDSQPPQHTDGNAGRFRFLKRGSGTTTLKNRYQLEKERQQLRQTNPSPNNDADTQQRVKNEKTMALEAWREKQKKLEKIKMKKAEQKYRKKQEQQMKRQQPSDNRNNNNSHSHPRQQTIKSSVLHLNKNNIPPSHAPTHVPTHAPAADPVVMVEQDESMGELQSASMFTSPPAMDIPSPTHDNMEQKSEEIGIWDSSQLPIVQDFQGGNEDHEDAMDESTPFENTNHNTHTHKKSSTTSFKRHSSICGDRPTLNYPKYSHHHHTTLPGQAPPQYTQKTTHSTTAPTVVNDNTYYSTTRAQANKQATVFSMSKRDRLVKKRAIRKSNEKQVALTKELDSTKAGLQSQIERYNEKFNEVRRMKQVALDEFRRYQTMIQQFESESQQHKLEFETYKKRELRVLDKKKQDLDKKSRSLLNIPDRKQRDTIGQMREELSSLKKEHEETKSRGKARIDQLKKKVSKLSNEKKELLNDIKALEKQRLENWNGNNDVSATATSSKNASDSENSGYPSYRNHKHLDRPSTQGRMQHHTAKSLSSFPPDHSRNMPLTYSNSNYVRPLTALPSNLNRNASVNNNGRTYSNQFARNESYKNGVSISFANRFKNNPTTGRDSAPFNPYNNESSDSESDDDDSSDSDSDNSSDENHSRNIMSIQHSQRPNRITTTTAVMTAKPTAIPMKKPVTQQLSKPTMQPSIRKPEKACCLPDIPNEYKPDTITPQQNASDVFANRNTPLHKMQHPDGKIEQLYTDGSKLVTFPNGTEKCIFTNLYSAAASNNSGTPVAKELLVKFPNNDVKKVLSDGREVYYYASNKITHVTQRDGMQFFYFDSQQHEIHFVDGTKHILFADGTKKYIYPNGEEKCIFPNQS